MLYMSVSEYRVMSRRKIDNFAKERLTKQRSGAQQLSILTATFQTKRNSCIKFDN